jgi:hypothetical protein
VPGYQAVSVYLPEKQTTLVILTNTDISYQGSEPSTPLATAITTVLSPDHVYTIGAGVQGPSNDNRHQARRHGAPGKPEGDGQRCFERQVEFGDILWAAKRLAGALFDSAQSIAHDGGVAGPAYQWCVALCSPHEIEVGYLCERCPAIRHYVSRSR